MRKERFEILKNTVNTLSVNSIKDFYKPQEKKFIQSEAKEYTLNNGRKIVREELFKEKNNGSAVIIVPIIGNEILTVIEPRVFTSLTVGVGFPAGYIEESEEPLESAKRELREETGLEAEELIKLDSFYQDEGCSRALNVIYLAKNCKKKFEQDLDKDEIVETMLFTFEELLELE